jgi:hypothetical protein
MLGTGGADAGAQRSHPALALLDQSRWGKPPLLQRERAAVGELRLGQLGLQRVHLRRRAFHPGADLFNLRSGHSRLDTRKNLPCSHVLAFLEFDARHAPGNLRGNRRLAAGDHEARGDQPACRNTGLRRHGERGRGRGRRTLRPPVHRQPCDRGRSDDSEAERSGISRPFAGRLRRDIRAAVEPQAIERLRQVRSAGVGTRLDPLGHASHSIAPHKQSYPKRPFPTVARTRFRKCTSKPHPIHRIVRQWANFGVAPA